MDTAGNHCPLTHPQTPLYPPLTPLYPLLPPYPFAVTYTSGYSGQSLFDDWVHSAYNVILAFPVITIGVFDKVGRLTI